MKENLKWALVLSGGGARGIAHIGFLKGLEAAGFPEPSLVVGTSMGAIIGGLYACGMGSSEMTRLMIEEFKISDYLESFVFKIDGPVGQIFQTGQVLASLATHPGVDKGQRVLELFEKLTGKKTFEETKIPFRCNAVDLVSGREVVFRSGPVAKAMRASMSFPVFFEPLMEDGMCLVDGGLADNMPVAIARKEGYSHVLAVNVNRFPPIDLEELKGGPRIIIRSIESILHTMDRDKKDRAELTVDATDDATPFSFFRKKEFITLGERIVWVNMKILEDFFEPRYSMFETPRVCGLE